VAYRNRGSGFRRNRPSYKAPVEMGKVYTRSGTEAYVSNARIGDETGTIRMSLWNRQINIISRGDIIKIQNGTMTRFQGDPQLRIDKSRGLSVIE